MEISPEPKEVLRSAIVIIVNGDPDFSLRIKELIAQLGATSWKKREVAQTTLSKFLLPARVQLREALKNKDLEIVHRAEQLLEGR